VEQETSATKTTIATHTSLSCKHMEVVCHTFQQCCLKQYAPNMVNLIIRETVNTHCYTIILLHYYTKWEKITAQ